MTIVARWFLLISGPRVRVPGGAPHQQNPNFFPIGEGFGFFVLLRNWEINVLPFSLHGFPAPLSAAFPGSPLVLSQFLRRAVRLLAKIGALRQHFLLASPVGAVVSAALVGSWPGIPCRRSCGFQGAVLNLAIKNRHTTT